jgi:hypothetical protein
MINYIDTDDPVECPYCSSIEDCEHLFLLYDRTFNSMDAGFFHGNKLVDEILHRYFVNFIMMNGFKSRNPFVQSPELSALWVEILENKESYIQNGIFIEDDFYLPDTNDYIIGKLDEIIVPDMGEFEGGPGQSSSYYLYYTDDAQSTLQELLDEVKKELESL